MDSRSFTVLSLCSGAGGLDLGLALAEPAARVVCHVEIEAFACALLAARMEEGIVDDAPVWTDLRTFDGRPWRGAVDCITAGYPCQPFSVAGKMLGEKDPRHLWPEVARIVSEVEPAFCFFENVSGHLRLGFEQVHDDLRAMGYTVAAGLFTAEEVGAPHKRERLFILAYRHGDGCIGNACTPTGKDGAQGRSQRAAHAITGGDGVAAQRLPAHETGFAAAGDGRGLRAAQTLLANPACAREQPGIAGEFPAAQCGSDGCLPRVTESASLPMEHTDRTGLEGRSSNLRCADRLPTWPPSPTDDEGWRSIEDHLKPAIHRMADGMAHRVDRIRTCGNGVVPLVAAYAWRTLRAHF